MATSTSPTLPLARPPGSGRAGEPHRNLVSLPERRGRDTQELVLAAVAAVLHRYTGEERPAVGRRTPSGTEAVELELSADLTAGELLAAAAAARGRPSGDQPLQALVCAPGEEAPEQLAALTVLTGTDKLQLLMRREEFDSFAAAQYARHLEQVLNALTADPAVTVRELPLLTAEETHRALVEWNRTEEPVPAPFFHELVAEHARRTPDAVAVAMPGERVTYRELDDRANQLARRMASMGIRPRDRVGVCFPRGADSLISQIACFKLAVAAILLDPGFPVERLRFMIEDSSASAVLSLAEHEEAVSGACPVLSLDTADWRDEPTDPVHEPVTADDIIHVGYTSGSTGTPKAVLARFGAARNLIHSMRDLCGMDGGTQGTWLAAPGYGMVQVECFPVLAAGATVHIPEAPVVASPQQLQEWFLEHRITTTLLMKPMAEKLWTLDWPEGTPLRTIRVCGERIHTWPPQDLPFHLINLYGSTEATTAAGCDITELGRRLGEEGRAHRLPPIGRPICNVRIYVLDEDLRPVPPGVVGELCITGEGLSAGYLDRPELTAQRWIDNPIAPGSHPVMYRTGDMARYCPDGSIEIVGRRDNQIKVSGNTVHLGEIEVVLAAQPGVRQAVVLPHKDSHGDVRLTAYIEPAPGVVPSVRDLRRALRLRLPAFMVPGSYVVGEFATARNGKIDRAALPEPPRTRPDVDSPYREPRDDIERALRGLWEDILELQGVGVLDNFFELGGDSLRAARLTEQACRFFGVELALGDLFHEPSIDRMATLVRTAVRG
ncbi:amino acid adenylation domain-containing protein [Streptomyces sp. NPDC085927]|uniref:amino acid adenylation domain-containing protein n=1 Tax=Streptomyces sp. NPDC085927 TaxID=3365738 RepID=UPI0037CE38D8